MEGNCGEYAAQQTLKVLESYIIAQQSALEATLSSIERLKGVKCKKDAIFSQDDLTELLAGLERTNPKFENSEHSTIPNITWNVFAGKDPEVIKLLDIPNRQPQKIPKPSDIFSFSSYAASISKTSESLHIREAAAQIDKELKAERGDELAAKLVDDFLPASRKKKPRLGGASSSAPKRKYRRNSSSSTRITGSTKLWPNSTNFAHTTPRSSSISTEALTEPVEIGDSRNLSGNLLFLEPIVGVTPNDFMAVEPVFVVPNDPVANSTYGYDVPKPASNRNPWSDQEQNLLEELLIKFPHGTRHRWSTISDAMQGSRNARQIANRVQKLSGKLSSVAIMNKKIA